MKPTLLVLAAGMGSRYGGLKQIDPMGPSGETILDYSVFDCLRAGFGKVVFIVRPDFEAAFRDRVVSRFAERIDTALAFQTLDRLPSGFTLPAGREKPWGTTHA
ncbi:MAG: nucleotidyltransferase, partial [Planctomycetaceae bacterium]